MWKMIIPSWPGSYLGWHIPSSSDLRRNTRLLSAPQLAEARCGPLHSRLFKCPAPGGWRQHSPAGAVWGHCPPVSPVSPVSPASPGLKTPVARLPGLPGPLTSLHSSFSDCMWGGARAGPGGQQRAFQGRWLEVVNRHLTTPLLGLGLPQSSACLLETSDSW